MPSATPDPSAELPERPDRRGYCWDCECCNRQLCDQDPVAFVDGAAYCIERCVSFDVVVSHVHRPSIIGAAVTVGGRLMYATAIRFDYCKVVTIHIRTTAAPDEPTPAAGKPGPRVAWIRELDNNGRPILQGQGVLWR